MAVRLPDLEQKIDIDTSDLAKAIAEAQAFSRAMERALRVDTSRLHNDLSRLNGSLSDVRSNADKTGDSLSQMAQKMQQMTAQLNGARGALQNVRQDITNLERDSRALAGRFTDIGNGISGMGEAARRNRTNMRNFVGELDRVANMSNGLEGGLQGITRGLDGVGDSFDRNRSSLSRYNDELDRLNAAGNGGQTIGAPNAPGAGGGYDDSNIDAVRNATRAFEELHQSASRLNTSMHEANDSAQRLNGTLNGLGGGTGANNDVAQLRQQISDLNDEVARLQSNTQPATQRVREMGREAQRSEGDLSGLAAAFGSLNGAMNTSFITRSSKFATIIGGIAGVIGAAGAGVAQLGAGVFGLGAALAPVVSLGALLPSMIAGVGLLGATVKIAFSEGDNQFGKQIAANMESIKNLGKEIQTVVQQQVAPAFANLTETIVGLRPALQDGFRGMGEVVAGIVEQFNSVLQGDRFKSQFASLFASAIVQARNYGTAVVDAFRALTEGAGAGIPIAERLSDRIRAMAAEFRVFMERANDSGALTRALELGYDRAQRFVGIVADLGRGFMDLGRAARVSGLDVSILESLERGAEGFRNFASTYKVQLKGVFDNAKETFDGIGEVVSQLGRTIMLDLGQINLGPLLSEVADFIGLLGKIALPNGQALVGAFRDIFSAINDASGPLQNIGDVLSGVIEDIGGFGASVIPNLIGPLQQISAQVAIFVQDVARVASDLVPALTDPLVQVVGSSRELITSLIELFAPLVAQIAQPFADAFSTIQTSISDVATGISGPLQQAFGNVLPVLGRAISDLAPPMAELVIAVGELVAAFSDSFGGAIAGVVGILTPVIGIFTELLQAAEDLPGPVTALVTALIGLRLLSPVGGILRNAATHMTGLGTAIAGANAAAGGGLAGLRGGLSSLVGFLGGPWGLALAAAGTALVLFGQNQADAEQKAAEHERKLQALRDTLNQVTGAMTAATTQKIAEDLFSPQLVGQLNNFNSTIGEMAGAVARGGQSFRDFREDAVNSFLAVIDGSKSYQEAVSNGAGGVAILLKRYSDEAGVSMRDLATAWASGGAAYDALAQRVAAATGLSVDQVKNGFEQIRSTVNETTGGMASGLTAIGDASADVVTASNDVKTAFENQVGAAGSLVREIEGYANVTDQQLVGAMQRAQREGIPVSEALRDIGVTGQAAAVFIASMGDSVDGTTGKLVSMGDGAREAYEALVLIAENTADAIPNAQALGDAFGVMGDQASTAADKARALSDIMDIMSGNTKTVTDAQFAWADELGKVKDKVNGLKESNAGFVEGINASNGALDSSNAAHRQFRDVLQGMADDYAMNVAAAQEAAKANGDAEAGVRAGYEAARQSRAEFVALAQDMGFSAEAANRLADDMGLIPEETRVALTMDGTDQLVQQQVANVIAQIGNIPEGTVTLKSGELTDDTLKKLDEMGYKIEKLPTGEVKISDNFQDVRGQLDYFINTLTTLPNGTMTIEQSEITTGTMAALEDLGYKVTKGYDGKITITAETQTADQAVAALTERANVTGSVTVAESDVTADTRQKLIDMGYTVQSLPNGFVSITSNAAIVKAEVDTIVGQVTSIPAGSVRIEKGEVTNETINALIDLGYQITALPNGAVVVTSNVPEIDAQVQTLRTQVGSSINGVMVIDSATTTTEALTRLGDLGYTITGLPEGRVRIEDNTNEVNGNLDVMNGHIKTVPDGDFKITDNTTQVNGNINSVDQNINAIPDGDFNISDNTPQANSNVNGLSGNIRSIPDKQFTVTAATQQAAGAVTSIVGQILGIPNKTSNVNVTSSGVGSVESAINYAARPRTAVVNLVSSGGGRVAVAEGALFMPRAKGAIDLPRSKRQTPQVQPVIPMASGGMLDAMFKRAIPMSNRVANIIPPNTPRLIGDNVRVPELFLPLEKFNLRSIALLQKGAAMMDYDLVSRKRKRGMAMADGGVLTRNKLMQLGKYGEGVGGTVVDPVLMNKLAAQQANLLGDQLQSQFGQMNMRLNKILMQLSSLEVVLNKNMSRGASNFVFNQYNPQAVPQAEMINRALQAAAAAGLLGGPA